ncbi:glycosyltransferase [Brachyspira pilosicoli]|uniref:Glycosyltransferase n=2 Tax=Brachyspira pilosicoli TaxID=52584 RepID=A0A5C8ECQ1_BRAPL|nr:glycosyltransferase [Brachyspira pilosicoli]
MMIIKKIMSFIYKREDVDIYSKTTIFGLKIVTKPYRLKANLLQKRLDNLCNKNKEIEKETKDGFYNLYLKNKDKVDYNKLIGNIPYVSIIVPVYNTGKELLIRCLDSLINQTLKNIEIIIVNDCSPLEEDDIVCKDYANKDKRIKYIYNKENMGSGGARLEGLKYVTGYSTAFVDSDDYLKLEAYDIALFSMFFYDVDIVSFGFYKIQSKINEVYLGNFSVYNNVLKYFINDYVHVFLWNKLYKSSLILNSDKKLMPDNLIGEDRVFNFYVFSKAESLSLIPISLYYYDRNTKNSQTLITEKKYITETLYAYDIIIKENYHIVSDIYVHYSKAIYVAFYRIFYEYKNIDNNKYYKLKDYLKSIIISQLYLYPEILDITLMYDYLIYNYFSNDFHMFFNDVYNTVNKVKINNFVNSKKDKNYVLVTELNDVHGEVIPGIVKYFLDLSYKVDILVTFKQLASGVLNAFKNNENVKIFCYDRENLINIIKNENLSEYKCIFITSYYLYYVSSNWPSVKDYIKNIDKKNKNMIIMEHHLDLVNEKYIRNNQIAVMHNLQPNKFPIYINPHYFGDVKITSKSDNIIKFIIVGWIESHRKNFDLLFNGFNKLLQNGFTNFKLIIVGKGNITSDIGLLYKYIDVKGRLNYPDMYKEIEEADFFLPLLDNENPDHDRYLKYGVSGSFQLIYGFRKPCILNRKFAETYGINNDNSILYDNNEDFIESLKKAINMNNDEYFKLQNNLKIYADNLYNKSLENLKYILKK